MNNQNELITIIIPTYNSEKYLKECLDSIISQTYKNIEIIIVDGNSTDKTNEIINSYCKRYKIIRSSQSNKGVSKQRNVGLELANGKYIAFIDSDDYVNSTYINELYLCLINNNLDIVSPSIIVVDFDDAKNTIIKTSEKKGKYISPLNNNNFYYYGYKSYCHGPYKLYKQSIIEDYRFNEDLTYGEDSVFNYSLVKNKSINFGVANNSIYYYRKEISTTPAKKRFNNSSLLYFNFLLAELKRNKIQNNNREGLVQIIYKNYSAFYNACRYYHKIYIPFILLKTRFILFRNIKTYKDKIVLLFPRLAKLIRMIFKKY